METEEDGGIFLFKTSKTKVSTESIFAEVPGIEIEEGNFVPKFPLNDSKWMKNFLRRFQRPSLLHTPLIAFTGEEIVLQSMNLPPFVDAQGEVVELKNVKMRKITRGNRRHKIKTRRQRNLKKKKKPQ